jgi:AMIN domain-containing protein
MTQLPKIVWISFLGSAFVLSLTPKIAAQNAQIRHVRAVKSGDSTQIEIETSQRLLPLTEVVTDPDRLVIDFADAVPGPQLRALTVNNGAVKGVRVGKVTTNPPVTRIVVDLSSPLAFQLFPSNKSVVVKLGNATQVASITPIESVRSEPAPAPSPKPSAPAASLRVVAASVPVAAVQPTISVTRWPVAAASTGQIRRVAVLKSGGATEIEIETSQRLEPAVQALTGPDRLVIDFPAALPGPKLRALTVNQGEVKGVRVGLLSAKPPVTRIVLDLNSAQVYQMFPTANSVIVKLPGSATAVASASMPSISETAAAAPPPPKKVDISLTDGKLSVRTAKATLAEILNELHVQTGAEIVVPPGADQEQVAVALGPGSPREVISRMLDGSRYNFIIVGTDSDANQVERLVLSPKTGGGVTAPNQSPIDPTPVAQMQDPQRSNGAAPSAPPPAVEDAEPQADSAAPDTTPQPGDPQAAPN